MKTKVSLRCFVNYCLWKLFFDSNSPHTSSNLICLTFLVTLRPLHRFNLKLEQLSGKKDVRFALLHNSSSDVFTEIEIWYYKNFKFVLVRFLER